MSGAAIAVALNRIAESFDDPCQWDFPIEPTEPFWCRQCGIHRTRTKYEPCPSCTSTTTQGETR